MDLASRISQFGLTQVYQSPERPAIDIVFVHGLNGHPHLSWTSEATGTFWPVDLLPDVLASHPARILTWGYNASITAFTDGSSKDGIINHAETLVAQLIANRRLRRCIDRPIVFVCHSLGGLVVKRALLCSRSLQPLRSVYISTYGILFLGTPHNGPDITKWGVLLQNLCTAVMPKKFIDTSPSLVKVLKTNNETLQNVNSLFMDIMPRFHIYCFYEEIPTDVGESRDMVVDERSAAPYADADGVESMGINADHKHMCKFDHGDAPGYEVVAEALIRYSRDAHRTIQERWVEENKTLKLLRKDREVGILGESTHLREEYQEPEKSWKPGLDSHPTGTAPEKIPYLSDIEHSANVSMSRSSRNPYIWAVPPGFQPNSSFFGMQKELEVLHARLFKAKKRLDRPMAVLICGIPGSGKSHLARQYVWAYRDHYPGGIFWINAESRQAILKCFQDIALLLIERGEFQNPDSKSPTKYVEAVRSWLQSHDQWLIIFDGVHFAHDEDINEFKQFIPYKEQSSIIYTSIDSTLRRKQRLFEPFCLMIQPLGTEDACKLLFKGLGIHHPTHEQLQSATKVVHHYECHPLAINAITHRLRAAQKPIEEYHVNSHVTYDKLTEPFLDLLHDLYWAKHFAALNLINILSFLGHNIPVRLIYLGLSFLKGWRIEVLTSSGPEERGDFDTTLGILIRFGLIERTSNSYPFQGSLSQYEENNELETKAGVADLPESESESDQEGLYPIHQSTGMINTVRVHGVVQRLCRDALRNMDKDIHRGTALADQGSTALGYYESWLVVATHVFCTSYNHAKEQINRLDNSGSIKDYREYEIHASQLIRNYPNKTSQDRVREGLFELRVVLKHIRNKIEEISPRYSEASSHKYRSVFEGSYSVSSGSDSISSGSDGPSRQSPPAPNDMELLQPGPPGPPKEIMYSSPHDVDLGPFKLHTFGETRNEKKDEYKTGDESQNVVARTTGAMPPTNPTERFKSSQPGLQSMTLSQSSVFDQHGWSNESYISTMITSQGIMEEKTSAPSPDTKAHIISDNDYDRDTTYSLDSSPDVVARPYIRAFASCLAGDIGGSSGLSEISDIPSEDFEHILKTFSWHLHGESSTPFQWEACVTLHRRRREIMNLISSTMNNDPLSTDEALSENETDSEAPERRPFEKPADMMSEWVNNVESGAPDDVNSNFMGHSGVLEDSDEEFSSSIRNQERFNSSSYKEFIQQSDSYQWLLSKIGQYGTLAFEDSGAMLGMCTKIQSKFVSTGFSNRMSRQRPSVVRMTFHVDWNPLHFVRKQGFDLQPSDALDTMFCLTGSQHEVQATTVTEYIDQTWPVTGKPILNLLRQLLSAPEGEECFYQNPELDSSRVDRSGPKLIGCIQSSSCSISVTSGLSFISELAEQIGWLTSVLRPSPNSEGVITWLPRIDKVDVRLENKGTPRIIAVGSCQVLFDFKKEAVTTSTDGGLCWTPLFGKPVSFVGGYPIRRRPLSQTGIEMPLAMMAALVGSQQVVQWGSRILIKGFDSLLVATLACAGVITWHLVVNENHTKRISYTDPRVDALGLNTSEELFLRKLEASRHIVGWCPSATDFCGHASIKKLIQRSGVQPLPGSMVIDRLYIEGGASIGPVAGINIKVNQQEQPRKLRRHDDYPSMLEWISAQAIMFYDVSNLRAWLVDGASALLHLVRLSLNHDEKSPVYQWEFDPGKFKDTWSGLTGRLAALMTLSDWDNLALNVYVKDRKTDSDGKHRYEYLTFKERVMKIIHAVEILVDWRVEMASKEGLIVPNRLDLRKGVVGFDILDIIKPREPVKARVTYLNLGDEGWVDLIPSMGITTIFGREFGDLIRPDDPSTTCMDWESVPTGRNYMATSVTTLKMLVEERMQSDKPGLDLGVGEMTRNIIWTSQHHPFITCGCRGGERLQGWEKLHLNPVQILKSRKSLMAKIPAMQFSLDPVDLAKLEETGALVFGHLRSLYHKKALPDTSDPNNVVEEQQLSPSVLVAKTQSISSPSITTSDNTAATQSTGITIPALQESVEVHDNSKNKNKRHSKWLVKPRWSLFSGRKESK